MTIGKYAYFIPSLAEKPIRGKIVKIHTFACNFQQITIRTKNGDEYSGATNQFSLGYPKICKYWGNQK